MKMKQPELGRKIAELRKSKGLTQEELVERCNLSVRTLQRIENGEVIPRSHTLRVILAALEYEDRVDGSRPMAAFLNMVGNLFNLKINTMAKISALAAILSITALLWLGLSSDSQAQDAAEVRATIEMKGKDFVRWFNNGQLDSLMTQFSDDACLLAVGCGKAKIRAFYQDQANRYRFHEFAITSVSVADSIAVEKGEWTVILEGGMRISGVYMTEWRKTGDDWLIIHDISDTY
jgi:transcriptional regulator with XRE-family HTH domain